MVQIFITLEWKDDVIKNELYNSDPIIIIIGSMNYQYIVKKRTV